MPKYQPSIPPVIADPLAQEIFKYILRELEQVADSQNETDSIQFRVLHREPTKPREGALVFADGSDWDPGSGRGLYLYNNGAWEQVYATA